MKLIKKLLLCIILSTLTILFYTQTQDYIRVNKNTNTIENQAQPELELNPTNPKYKNIESEIAKLKRRNSISEKVNLSDEANKALAPELYSIINEPLTKICQKAGITTPDIVINAGTSNDSYNASADRHIEYWEEKTITTKGDKTSTQTEITKNQTCTFTIGEGLIKLLLWEINGDQVLESIIAHEVGHMKQNENMQPKLAELDADATAVKLLGKSKVNELIRAINMSTLSGHIFNTLAGQADIFKLSLEDVHQLNRIITNSITKKYGSLGDLGLCSSHTKFGCVINKVFQDALKYSFDPKTGLTENNFFKIYEKLEKACKNMTDFMGEKQNAEISLKCAYVEEYSDKYFSPTTHPTPEQRFLHIIDCANQDD